MNNWFLGQIIIPVFQEIFEGKSFTYTCFWQPKWNKLDGDQINSKYLISHYSLVLFDYHSLFYTVKFSSEVKYREFLVLGVKCLNHSHLFKPSQIYAILWCLHRTFPKSRTGQALFLYQIGHKISELWTVKSRLVIKFWGRAFRREMAYEWKRKM